MRKDFLTIVDNVSSEMYDTSQNMITLIKNYVNKRYFDVLRRINWNTVNRGYSFTTVVGQSDYPLNSDFDKVVACNDATNGINLKESQDLGLLYQMSPYISSNLTVSQWYLIIEDVVRIQPPTASQVSIVSDSTADTTTKILIRGICNNSEITEQVTVTGTSTATSVHSYTYIKGLSKDSNSVGTITISVGSNTLSVMPPKMLVSRYKIIRLYPTPSQAIPITLPYLIKPFPLIEDNDYPIIDIDDIIEMGAKADGHSYQRREATSNKYESIYESMIVNYIWHEKNKPNQVTMLGVKGYSRDTVGAYYGADPRY